MQETPWGRPKALDEKAPERPKWGIIDRVWGLAYITLMLGAVIGLGGSLWHQLYTPIAEMEPRDAKVHTTWCVGHLKALKVELEEAVLQEIARHHPSDELTRSERARRRTWSKRLEDVRSRCHDNASLENSGRELKELAARYDALVDSLTDTRQGLAQQIERHLLEAK